MYFSDASASPRQMSSSSSGNNQQLVAVGNSWIGQLNTQVYDDKLVELSNQSTNHLSWLARNRALQLKDYGQHQHKETLPHSARLPLTSADRPFSQSSWTNMSVMFTSTASRRTDDTSSTMSSTSRVKNFCYLCSTLEEHQRNHLKLRSSMNMNGSLQPKRQRIRYIAPKLPSAKRKAELRAPDAAAAASATTPRDALYKVTVWTGDLPGASTDANVFITMVGDQGVLLRTQLWHRQGTSKFSFVRGSKEMFHVKGPKLGSLRTLTVEHDGVEQRHGWYLDRIEVQCMLTCRLWVFLCKNWLSLHHGDSTIKRELEAAMKERVVREYEITVETGQKRFAGTDANVYIMLNGTEGSTCKHHLNPQHPHGTCFQRGQTDKFKIQVADIGDVRSLRIEHDGEGMASSWYLTKVTIRDMQQPQCVFFFPCNGWLAKDIGDGKLWRELRALKHLPNGVTSSKPLQYEVTVKTGDIRCAGTNADVYIIFIGTSGKTGKMFLSDTTTDFERSKTDSFMLKAVNVGTLKSIVVGVDSSGPDAGWFCEHIKVRKALTRQEMAEKLTQEKQSWKEAKEQQQLQKQLADKVSLQDKENVPDNIGEQKNEDAKSTLSVENEPAPKTPRENASEEREADVTEEQKDGASTLTNFEKETVPETQKDDTNALLNVEKETAPETHRRNVREKKETKHPGVFSPSGRVLKIPVCIEYFFPCSKWFASDHVDSLIERELTAEKQKLCYQDRR